jgi:hypothetical protein
MKKYMKLNRDYNGIPKNTIGLIVSTPNYFVKDMKFGEKIIRIDNTYLDWHSWVIDNLQNIDTLPK